MSSSLDIYKISCAQVFYPKSNDSCGLCFSKLGEDAISLNEEVILRCSGEEVSEPVSVLLLYVLGEKVNITYFCCYDKNVNLRFCGRLGDAIRRGPFLWHRYKMAPIFYIYFTF